MSIHDSYEGRARTSDIACWGTIVDEDEDYADPHTFPKPPFYSRGEPVHIPNSLVLFYDWICELAVSTSFLSPPMTRVHGQRDSQHINISRCDPPFWKWGLSPQARWKEGSCLRPKHAVPQEKGWAKKTGACNTGGGSNILKVVVHVCS